MLCVKVTVIVFMLSVDGDDVSGKDNLVGQFPKCDDSTGGEWSNQHQWCSSPELCQILQQLYKGKHYFHRKSPSRIENNTNQHCHREKYCEFQNQSIIDVEQTHESAREKARVESRHMEYGSVEYD